MAIIFTCPLCREMGAVEAVTLFLGHKDVCSACLSESSEDEATDGDVPQVAALPEAAP